MLLKNYQQSHLIIVGLALLKNICHQTIQLFLLYIVYKIQCESSNPQKTPVSETVFKNVFTTKFNIEFHSPKKDKCNICESMKNIGQDKFPINNFKIKFVQAFFFYILIKHPKTHNLEKKNFKNR